MFKIQNLHVRVGDKIIVRGINLRIKRGQLHVMMGPNGSGKSTLAHALMGHPDYLVVTDTELAAQGKQPAPAIFLDGNDITGLAPDERAKHGLFLSFQHPISIPGISVSNFLRVARQSLFGGQAANSAGKAQDMLQFNKQLMEKAANLGVHSELLKRGLNEGFSGGEKKKLEMLQLIILQPKYAVIDEIDTGLDIDALKIVARGIKQAIADYATGILLITHYQRILRYIRADFVHVLVDGRIVETGDYKLVKRVQQTGYKLYE